MDGQTNGSLLENSFFLEINRKLRVRVREGEVARCEVHSRQLWVEQLRNGT